MYTTTYDVFIVIMSILTATTATSIASSVGVSSSLGVPGSSDGDANGVSTICIGGLFPLTNHPTGSERAAAARIAVDMVNNDKEIMRRLRFAMEVVDTKKNEQEAVRAVIKFLSVSSNATNGVSLLIGAASSSVSESVSGIASIYGVPQISYSSTSSTLSNKNLFPTFFRTVPNDVSQAFAWLELLKLYKWVQIAVLATSDDYGLIGISNFLDLAVDAGITILGGPQYFDVGGDAEAAVTAIRNSGANIIILNAVVFDARTALLEAERQGMLAEFGYLWILSDGAAQDTITHEPHRNRLLSVLNGGLGVVPSFIMENSKQSTLYMDFMNIWRTLNSTEYPGAGDDTINLYGLFAFDTVWTYAHALDSLISEGFEPRELANIWKTYVINDSGHTRDILVEKILNATRHVNFIGTTGIVSFTPDGDRRPVYGLLNLRSNGSWAKVGFFLNDRISFVSKPRFYHGTSPPRDLSAYVPNKILRGIILGVTTIIVFLFLLIIGVIFRYRKLRAFRAASPRFLYLMLLGGLLQTTGVILLHPYPQSDVLCMGHIVSYHMGFVFLFTAIFLRMWRVMRIFQKETHDSSRLTDARLFSIACVVILVNVVFVSLWMALSPPKVVTSTPSRRNNILIEWHLCGRTNWDWIAVCAELAALLAGVWLAFRVRNAPQLFNESKLTAFGIYNWSVMGVIFGSLLMARDNSPDLYMLWSSLSVLLTTPFLLALVLFPLCWLVYCGKADVSDDDVLGTPINGERDIALIHLVERDMEFLVSKVKLAIELCDYMRSNNVDIPEKLNFDGKIISQLPSTLRPLFLAKRVGGNPSVPADFANPYHRNSISSALASFSINSSSSPIRSAEITDVSSCSRNSNCTENHVIKVNTYQSTSVPSVNEEDDDTTEQQNL